MVNLTCGIVLTCGIAHCRSAASSIAESDLIKPFKTIILILPASVRLRSAHECDRLRWNSMDEQTRIILFVTSSPEYQQLQISLLLLHIAPEAELLDECFAHCFLLHDRTRILLGTLRLNKECASSNRVFSVCYAMRRRCTVETVWTLKRLGWSVRLCIDGPSGAALARCLASLGFARVLREFVAEQR